MIRVYLASPYYHKSEYVRQKRHLQAALAAGFLMKWQGYCVYAPIVQSKTIADLIDLPHSFEGFWESQDFCHIDSCDELHVLRLDGWQQSQGVKAEIDYADSKNMPIHYWDFQSVEQEESILKYGGTRG